MALRIVIIEDEPAIARHLKRLLEEIDGSNQVVHVVDSIKSGISWFSDNEGQFDLIFSDIQLLDGTSFTLFEKVQPTKPIIFVTAYEEYTLDAFNTNGIFYIIKPFQKDNIAKALEKYKFLVSNGDNHLVNMTKIQPLLENLARSITKYKQAYLVHYQDKLVPIKTSEIAWFYTENEIVYVYTHTGKRYAMDTSLERVSAELSPDDFIRANRKFIVSRLAIRDIDFYFHGRLIVNVVPAAEQQIIVSKAKVPIFKKWMNQE